MIIAVSSEFGDDLVKFVYYRIENGKMLEREEVNAADNLDLLLRQLNGLKIDLLISGRISAALERQIFEAGINLISGLRGQSDHILQQYLNGTLEF